MFLSSFCAPIRWGDPVRRGPLSKQAKQFFGGSTADCLWCSKGAAGNLQGKPKPARLELVSEAAERGNYPEAKPNEERLKGRRACKKNKLSMGLSAKITMTFGRLTEGSSSFPCPERKKKETHVETLGFRFRLECATSVQLVLRPNVPRSGRLTIHLNPVRKTAGGSLTVIRRYSGLTWSNPD
jgi:hypothetical protein